MKDNREILASVIACMTFWGSHDLALKGEDYGKQILEDLYKLWIDERGVVMKESIEQIMVRLGKCVYGRDFANS